MLNVFEMDVIFRLVVGQVCLLEFEEVCDGAIVISSNDKLVRAFVVQHPKRFCRK